MNRPTPPHPTTAAPGFTLIEVLLAVLVLGLFLSIAFAKQAESVVLESRARLEALAGLQIRCKAAELELLFLTEGFPAADEADAGPCCEAFEDERFNCAWTVEAITLPSASDIGERMQQDRTSQTLVATGDDEEASSFQDQMMGMFSMAALGRILPTVQTLLQEAIRKVEITVVWKYRNVLYDFTVSQYVTNTSQGALGAFLQQQLVQDLLTGGPEAWFRLFAPDDGSGGEDGGGDGGGQTP